LHVCKRLLEPFLPTIFKRFLIRIFGIKRNQKKTVLILFKRLLFKAVLD